MLNSESFFFVFNRLFFFCVVKIVIYESSSKFGGWIDTKKIAYGDQEVHFEKGPRTLRIATGELKELNSLQMVSS